MWVWKFKFKGKFWPLKFFNSATTVLLIHVLSRWSPKVSNTPSTMSIAHAQLARSAPKVASWKQNLKIQKLRIFKFFVKPVEISIRTEISIRLYHSFITWSNTVGYGLSNALSTMCMRHVEQVEHAFKLARKNAKSTQIQLQTQNGLLKSWKTLIQKKKLSFSQLW